MIHSTQFDCNFHTILNINDSKTNIDFFFQHIYKFIVLMYNVNYVHKAIMLSHFSKVYCSSIYILIYYNNILIYMPSYSTLFYTVNQLVVSGQQYWLPKPVFI